MNNGLYVRVPRPDRLEWFGKATPRIPLVFLTNNVADMLKYPELSAEMYGIPFDRTEDYWSYATSARCFSRKRLRPGVSLELEEGGAKAVGKPAAGVTDKVEEAETVDLNVTSERRDGIDELNDYLSTCKPSTSFTNEWMPSRLKLELLI